MTLMNMFAHNYKSTHLYATPEAEPRGILSIKKKKTKQDLVNAIIVATDISINIKSLRKELEQQKIMKGFGY